jgi:hypothetical protein
VVLHGELAVSLLDLLLVGALRNLKSLCSDEELFFIPRFESENRGISGVREREREREVDAICRVE